MNDFENEFEVEPGGLVRDSHRQKERQYKERWDDLFSLLSHQAEILSWFNGQYGLIKAHQKENETDIIRSLYDTYLKNRYL